MKFSFLLIMIIISKFAGLFNRRITLIITMKRNSRGFKLQINLGLWLR